MNRINMTKQFTTKEVIAGSYLLKKYNTISVAFEIKVTRVFLYWYLV